MDWRGRFDSNGIWHPSGRWGKDGTWRGASAPRRSGAHGQVSGHGVIRLRSRGAERFIVMRAWSDAVRCEVGACVRFTLDTRGQAVNVALAPGQTDKWTNGGDQRRVNREPEPGSSRMDGVEEGSESNPGDDRWRLKRNR